MNDLVKKVKKDLKEIAGSLKKLSDEFEDKLKLDEQIRHQI